ncbi:MAG TPA: hypothetical protein VH186_03500 [Chloroflexia bacterium]|nr:hypothetical protein [Chloroflexia bacterium]
MSKKRTEKQAKFRDKLESKKVKAIEKTVKAQIYQLGQPQFVKMLGVIAQLPFSTTEEILTLSGGLAEGLSLNRTQIYLRRAVDWGWLNFVNYYRGTKNVSDLNPVAISGLTCLFYSSNLPLDSKVEEEYFESLIQRPAVTSKTPTQRARHFYLTSIGAKVLAQLVQLYQHENHDEPKHGGLHSWQNEFAELFGFRETEVLQYANRLEGRHLSRQYLLLLAKNLSNRAKVANNSIVFSWQECGVLGQKLYSSKNLGSHFWGYFDGFVSIGKERLLILADTEYLSPSWMMNYLNKMYSELEILKLLHIGLNSSISSSYRWNTRKLATLLDNLAEGKEFLMKPYTNSEIYSADNSTLKIVVLTRSKVRAILWREAFSRIPVSIEAEEALAKHSLGFEIISMSELHEKTSAIVEAVASSGTTLDGSKVSFIANSHPVTSQMAYYLKKLFSNQGETTKPTSGIYYPKDFLLENIEDFVVSFPFLKNLRFEERVLLDLFEQPSKRRLLFTLHTYGLLDALACSRLTSIEMTHLRLQLEQLEKAGLIARLWGATASKCRTWSRWTEADKDEELIEDNQPKTKSTFCTTPYQFDRQNLGGLSVNNSRQKYQDYGQLSYFTSIQAAELPFALESERLKRYYYFISEKGLLALLWLEGVSLTFEPRYQGELTRLARIRREIEAGERKLVRLDDTCTELIDTSSLFSDCTVPTKVDVKSNEVEDQVGFSWPSLLTEHFSGATNFFLSFPSRHLSLPFQTVPGIYPVTKKVHVEKLTHEKACQGWNCKERRQPLFENAINVELESWQTEPLCHRYYILPERLAVAGYDAPYSYIPNLRALKLETGGERGECLPDGYGEFIIERPGRLYDKALVYLEFERGHRNWTERYRGKIRSYLQLLWSEWLLQSIGLRQPLVQLSKIPRYLLIVVADASQERSLVELFKITVQEVLSQLLTEAHYKGYGPNGISRIASESRKEDSITQALLHGLQLQILATNETFLNSFGVMAPVWQRI